VIGKHDPINIKIFKDIIGEIGLMKNLKEKVSIIFVIIINKFIFKGKLMASQMDKDMLFVTLVNGNTKENC
jgi:hypothetical protein